MSWFADAAQAVGAWWHRTRARREPVPPDQPAAVEDVVARLRAVDQGLSAPDGVSAFNRMYLEVTELVLDRLAAGVFVHPAFLVRLDVVFAGLYLQQVSAAAVDTAWSPLFEARRLHREPIQFALAGMNAHINHDLPIALVRTCRQLGLTLDSPGVRTDYDAVTGVLAQVQEEVRQSFLQGVALEVDRDLGPVVTLVGNWSIARAREAAWATASALWQLADVPGVEAEFRATLGHSVAMASRFLLTPAPDVV